METSSLSLSRFYALLRVCDFPLLHAFCAHTANPSPAVKSGAISAGGGGEKSPFKKLPLYLVPMGRRREEELLYYITSETDGKIVRLETSREYALIMRLPLLHIYMYNCTQRERAINFANISEGRGFLPGSPPLAHPQFILIKIIPSVRASKKRGGEEEGQKQQKLLPRRKRTEAA